MRRVFFLLITLLVLVAGMFSQVRADRAVRFYEMLKHTKGQFYGKPFNLLPWQRQIVSDVYGTVREGGRRQFKYVYIEIPKKNGKSELAAAAALYHTFADGEMNGEIYGCAADREQAALVFDVAVDMIDQSPALKKRAKVVGSMHKIIDRVSGSVYKAESAEAYTKHGLNLSCCIFDELHAQPNRALWDVMTYEAGSARAQPIWWIITTAGDDPDRVTIGWEQHEYAASLLSGDIVDPSWYAVIYNYEGEDIYNEANWFKANPSLGVAKSLESMREAAVTAKNKPANERLFRWLDLNQWITTKLSTWLPIDLFDSTIGSWSRAELLGKECYLGIDLSSTTDLTAVCVLFPPQGEQHDWRCFWHCWIPEENMKERIERDHVPYDKWVAAGHVTATPGNMVDYTEVEKTILEIKKFYKVIEVPSDRAFAAMLLQRLEQSPNNLLCVDVPQTFKVMTSPMNFIEVLLKVAAKQQGDALEQLKAQLVQMLTDAGVPGLNQLLMGGLTHENNLVARWCFGNASIAKNGNEEIKLVKEHRGKSVVRTKRIDLVTSLVNAMARAQYYQPKLDLNAAILSDDWSM